MKNVLVDSNPKYTQQRYVMYLVTKEFRYFMIFAGNNYCQKPSQFLFNKANYVWDQGVNRTIG